MRTPPCSNPWLGPALRVRDPRVQRLPSPPGQMLTLPTPRSRRPEPSPQPHALQGGPALIPRGCQGHVCAVSVTDVAGRLPQVERGLGDALLLQEAPLDDKGHLLDLAEHPDCPSQVQPWGHALGGREGTLPRGGSSSCWGRGLLWARALACVARRVTCKAGGDRSIEWVCVKGQPREPGQRGGIGQEGVGRRWTADGKHLQPRMGSSHMPAQLGTPWLTFAAVARELWGPLPSQADTGRVMSPWTWDQPSPPGSPESPL